MAWRSVPEPIEYQPARDERGWVIETEAAYAHRMRSTVLPDWPEEVLIEWLHRHADDIDEYAFLDIKTFLFSREMWPLARLPGGEAFDDDGFCEAFSDVEERAQTNPNDWLALYMCDHGTWNTPIVLLDNHKGGLFFPDDGRPLRSPLHLLEGHRRLSFLNGLRQRGKAVAEHAVWVVLRSC